jgi:hypothetical protein
MEALDGSSGFDYTGEYTNVVDHSEIESVLSDGRKGRVEFLIQGRKTSMVETFEPNTVDSDEMQLQFCQAVLENFRHYAELSASDKI